jgi:hypothetical protein
MTAHTFDGLISLIRNLSVYRSDKTVAQQKEEACTYAAALAGQAPKVPAGWKLVEDFHVGDAVLFEGVEHTIFALGDRPGTFDIHQPESPGTDRWRNVPPSALKYAAAPKTLSAVRMLAEEEFDACTSRYMETNIDPHEAIRKFCEVNGLTLSAEPAKEPK